MKTCTLCLMMVWAGVALAQSQGPPPSSPSGAATSQKVRPIGVVTQIKTGSLTLRTDAGPELLVPLPEGISVLRVPPGAKDLKAASPIAASDVNLGDRVLIRGRVSDDQKSIVATSVIVIAKTDLEKAREAETLDWQRRGIGGLVKTVNPEAKEITISVPNTPPTPGSPTHPVVIMLAANAVLLRYAPDSVKFDDAKASTFQEIKVGDQVRAMGTKSDDGNRFAAERLVSGTFRNMAATVISVDPQSGTVTVKDLASGRPVAVRTNADSKLHRLQPFLAQMIAMFNSGEAPGGGTPPGLAAAGGSGNRPPAGATAGRPASAGGGGMGRGPRDFQQMLERTPAFTLGELKPGEALIVVSTAGANPLEVTAIVLLAGVEPILAARPKGSTQVNLGWNLGMGGGEGGGEGGP